MSEAPVRGRVVSGTEEASFDAVYRRQAVSMVRLAVLLVGSRQQAEEIVQDAFAELFERWDGIERPTAYLRTCVVNGCRRAHRQRQRDKREAVKARGREPAALDADHLADALAMLPARRRAAIVLRYYEDLPEAEIAKAIGVRPGTVKSLLHRGLAQLREVIEP